MEEKSNTINGTQFDDFYSKGKIYWETIEPTVDGMLGGFTQVTNVDIQASTRLLGEYFPLIDNPKHKPKFGCNQQTKDTRALDCGAGIGRVAKHLLFQFFETIDLVEQNQNFLKEVDNYIGESRLHRVGKKYCCGLQEFVPDADVKYDVVWSQWVTGHLTDDDFVSFLKRCKTALKEDGLIVIKDNITSSEEIDDDTNDSSVTRPHCLMHEIFEKAGLKLVVERTQYKMPKGLYPVKMFVLR